MTKEMDSVVSSESKTQRCLFGGQFATSWRSILHDVTSLETTSTLRLPKAKMSGDTIYVAGLPPEVTEQEIAEYFGQAGVVRTDKQTGLPLVWIYKDIKTGLPKGDAIVSFEDTYTAAAAIQWFHQKPMRGLFHFTTGVSKNCRIHYSCQLCGIGFYGALCAINTGSDADHGSADE